MVQFENYLTPQTYFTSAAMITLCEALFDCFKLMEARKKTKSILEYIVEAKKFFLTTSFSGSLEAYKGWTDYRHGFSEMKPYKDDIEQAFWVFSPYGLEPLSYIKYYCRYYEKVTGVLQKEYPKLFEQFQQFSDDDKEKLSSIFKQCINQAKRPLVFRETSMIQVPHQFNKSDKGESYYIDGTVGYNLLNVVNFYLDYFPHQETEEEKQWRIAEIILAKTLIDKTFKEKAFTHCSDKENVEAIYATRTAIATFLSWGVRRPLTQPMQEQISTEVKDQIKKLYDMIFVMPGAKNTEQTDIDINLETNAWSKDDIKKILQIGYIVGVSTISLSRNVQTKWISTLIETDEKLNDHDIMQANGTEIVDLFAKIINGENDDRDIVKIIKLPFLATKYKNFIENIQSESELSVAGNKRIETLLKFMDIVKTTFYETSEKDYIGDIINDCIN